MPNKIISGLKSFGIKIFRRITRFERRQPVLDLIEPGFICAEIGVWRGDLSKKILKKSPSFLHLIDPWVFMPEFTDTVYGKRNGNSQDLMDRIYQEVCQEFNGIEGVQIHRKSSLEAVRSFEDEYFDWVYLDGNHHYEYVRNDLEAYIPKVKSGGYITGDDYRYDRCQKGGPEKAVKELIREGSIVLIKIQNNQFILRKSGQKN
mgnify:CR=1 FL=1